MKKLTDEEIQKLVEAKEDELIHMDLNDVKTYQLIFEALKEEPSEGLPLGFADQVAQEAAKISIQNQVRRYWLFTSLSIFVALCLSVFFLLFYQQPGAMMFFEWIVEVRWIALFILFMFVIIQWADYRLINRRQSVH